MGKQTQLRQLQKEQSHQGLHFLPFCLHLLNSLLYGKTHYSQILG